MKVDYLIIGAGIAGTVLQHFLRNDDTVVLDPNPGGFKIGESIIPEHFHHPELRDMVPDLQALPSYSPKLGSTFVSGDSVAAFPLPERGAEVSMHIGRSELETFMHDRWATPIVRERARSVDVGRKIVETDRETYEVREQIIDCSGPAMVVARGLHEVQELWPVFARWAYFDITRADDTRFAASIRAAGKHFSRFDVPTARVVSEGDPEAWSATRSTVLTQIDDGLWTWQIPLFDRTRLSFGVVSRHGRVSERALFDIAERTHSPVYELSRRPRDDSDCLSRVHTRAGFARVAKTPATMAYILVGDAAAFADPIYSVGTGLAVNKAIEVAASLNEGGWSDARCLRYCQDHAALLARAVPAFEAWYSGHLMGDDETARVVQQNFLVGTAFQVGIATQYSRAIVDSAPGGPNPYGRLDVDLAGPSVSVEVARLLELGDDSTLLEWRFVGAYRVPGGVQHRWEREGRPQLIINTQLLDCATQYYRRAGPVTLSFMNLFDGPYPLDDTCVALFDELERRTAAAPAGWTEVIAWSG